ncbi:threonine/serine exporter family protein [Lactobacillus sp. PV034]|uniref:threonine/serine exporter family protein n=1 Tax=Lactobacillus sp. PV034 TaxID=2594495 RepID=UPI00224049BE|nr:threonine/serine exporter family protein [Lactobacillus sp. PV034]QNQ81279.1 threonine/serine exporter family protein [Lactobacillus sp. PV034]
MQEKSIDSTYAAEVLDTCLKAGRLMIQGGSEMYRVEDTMLRIAKNAGIEGSRCFTTPTGIFMSLGPHSYTQITQIKKRDINLELVDRVNRLSREFAEKKITLADLKMKLSELSNDTPNYPIWLQIVGAIALSCTLMVLFMSNYDWGDFPAAAFVGGVGYGTFLGIKKYTKVRFLAEFVTAALMGFLTIALCKIFPKLLVDNILIGALMTLVPGVAFTNALRDLIGGDILSGVARGIEALFTAIALGGGVGIAIKLLGV